MRGVWDRGEEGNNLCLKVILKFSTYFLFFKTKALHVGGEWGLNLALWEMSQTAIKCVFLSRGDYFTSCGVKTLRGSPPPGPWQGSPCASLGHSAPSLPELGALALPEEMSAVPLLKACLLILQASDSTSLTSRPILFGRREAGRRWPRGGHWFHRV